MEVYELSLSLSVQFGHAFVFFLSSKNGIYINNKEAATQAQDVPKKDGPSLQPKSKQSKTKTD